MTPPTFIPSYHDEKSVSELQYRQVGTTDMLVSALSFGASSLGGVFRQTDDAESGERREKAARIAVRQQFNGQVQNATTIQLFFHFKVK